MTRTRIIVAALATLPLAAGGTALADEAERRGLELANKSDTANAGFKGEAATLEMTLTNARGETIVRKMSGKIKETSRDGDKSIVTFHWPADVKGTRMLTWSHKRGSDDQWLYLPSIKRVKRISSRNKSGSFMGSEFAYEDIGSQEVEQYRYRYLGDDTLDGRDTWKLQRIPTDKRSGYSRQIVWLDKHYVNPIRIDYYDRKGKLLKTGSFEYQKIGRWYRPRTIRIVNHQTRKKSSITWQKRDLGKSFDDDDFDADELEF